MTTLRDLKAGDHVAEFSDLRRPDSSIARRVVARVTKSFIPLDDDSKWLLSGRPHGSSRDRWPPSEHIEPWSDKEHQPLLAQQRERIHRKRLIGAVEAVLLNRATPTEVLERLAAAIEGGPQRTGEG